MSKKAIDIVLLPPDDIMDLSIEHNHKAFKSGEAKIFQNKTDLLPHATLLMGVMDSESQEQISKNIESITKEFSPINLIIKNTEQNGLKIELEANLQKLHEALIKKIDPLLTHDASLNMYHKNQRDEMKPDEVYWVNNQVKNHSFENFWPHITTFLPDEIKFDPPIKFIADRLALCHLGYRNTCRKILFETKLNQ